MPIKWGLLATGKIARAFANGLTQTDSGIALAAASRDAAKVEPFCDELGIERRYGSYESLLEDPDVDVIYIATPHNHHAEWAIKAIDAGKHVLCEKPLTINHADAMTVIETARRGGVFLMEAFMYRAHPQMQELQRLIEEGTIGDVRFIEGSFGFNAGDDLTPRTMDKHLAGGGIMDVGCYPMSFCRRVAAMASRKPFLDPIAVHGTGLVGERSAIDEWATASLQFENGIGAQISTAVQVKLDNRAQVFGSKGSITLHAPWLANGRQAGDVRLTVQTAGSEPQEKVIHLDRGVYANEADHVAHMLAQGAVESDVMSWDDTLGNLRALDAWRQAIKLTFVDESKEAYRQPISKRPLAVAADARMAYQHIERIDKEVSRLVIGMDNQKTIAHATAMFDDFFARGGNCFDSAYSYGRGVPETLFGQWHSARQVRDQIVLITKAAHPPDCSLKAMHEQLAISLDRLQTDYVDIFFLHRDNLEIPIGEWVDALNEHVDAGRIRMFGGSNWTIERLEAANQYAKEHGKQPFEAVSNNFSLARMVNPVWAGCMAASTPQFRQWLTQTQTPNFAWSSQARGFFVPGIAHPSNPTDPILVRAWYSDDNFERQKRCFHLAAEKGAQPISIALAYVLHHPFPSFAVIGPRAISETVSSFDALDVTLTPEEIKFLNLEIDSPSPLGMG